RAERPLLATAALPAEAVPALERLAERCAIPVVTHGARTMCLPSSHAMHFGFEPGALLTDADLVIVIESDVPWIPHLQHPPGGCRVTHIGEDPFYVRYPMRSFPSDLALQAGPAQALDALARAVEPRLQMADARIAARRACLTECMRTRRAQLAKDSTAGTTISPEYLSRVIGETVGKDAVIINEYPLRPDHCAREKPGTFFALGTATCRRTWLGIRRSAWSKARSARQLRGRNPRRRVLHVRQSDGRTLGVRGPESAHPDNRIQQQPLRRRSPRHLVHVQGWRRW